MSRFYEMELVVENVLDKKTVEDVIGVCFEEFLFEDDDITRPIKKGDSLTIIGRGSLCGGESEGTFAERITDAIWKAVGRFVPVDVRATYLEDLPNELYEFGKDEYKLFLEEQKEETK